MNNQETKKHLVILSILAGMVAAYLLIIILGI
jgi:hypothetical protein